MKLETETPSTSRESFDAHHPSPSFGKETVAQIRSITEGNALQLVLE
jgi:hypothetical protein